MRPAVPAAVVAALITANLLVGVVTPAHADPPPPPAAGAARSELAALKVEREGSLEGYSRGKFPHWDDQGDRCDTREVVLKRDGRKVTTTRNCYPKSGSWFSPYDGQTLTDPHDIDIDHLVALAEAWRSGANTWSTARRQKFANDLEHAELWAVAQAVNEAKGGKDPATWKSPRKAVWCLYARAFIDMKYAWDLSVDEPEKQALADMLDHC